MAVTMDEETESSVFVYAKCDEIIYMQCIKTFLSTRV